MALPTPTLRGRGCHPAPLASPVGRDQKKTPLPVVINYKPPARSRRLSRVAAGASYKDAPSWKGRCRNAKLHSSDRHHLLYVLPPSPDP